MIIVNFEELQVGDYFRCPQDPNNWTWLKIKEKELYDDDSNILFNSLIISGISAGYDYSYEIDWCPPDMKIIKVDRPESFK